MGVGLVGCCRQMYVLGVCILHMHTDRLNHGLVAHVVVGSRGHLRRHLESSEDTNESYIISRFREFVFSLRIGLAACQRLDDHLDHLMLTMQLLQ